MICIFGKAMREQIDFLILAPLEEEIQALIDQINHANGIINQSSENPNLYKATIHKKHLVIFKLSRQGCLNSSVQVMNLLNIFDPEFTISFGIAGSLLSDIRLGDVVFGRTVYFYEPAKEIPGKTGNDILSQNYAYPCCQLHEYESKTKFKIHWDQPIASGEKLIADAFSKSRELIKNINRRMACVEMEAAGVAAAVSSHYLDSERNKFISIKGINDLADRNKGVETESQDSEKERKKTAALNAATALVGLINTIRSEYETIKTHSQWINKVRGYRGDFAISINKFSSVISKCTIDYSLLERAIFNFSQSGYYYQFQKKIPMYYHWRQFDQYGLHLVDYLYLVFCHKLSKSGLIDPIALITDQKDITTPEIITRQVESIIGTQPVYYSQVRESVSKYMTYCYHNGYDGDELDNIYDYPHKHGTGGKTALMKWIPYIAYKSRHLGACIVSCWNEHKPIYDRLLLSILPLQPIILERETIKIGGKEAKLDGAGKELIIDPPGFVKLNKWIKDNSTEDRKEVKNFIKCLIDTESYDDKINYNLQQILLILSES